MDHPVTPAVRMLRQHEVAFEPHLYDYVEHGGTTRSSSALGVPEHQVVKTLVFETDAKKPLIVLMHGDKQVSAKNLARHMGVKSVARLSYGFGRMSGGLTRFMSNECRCYSKDHKQ